MEQQTNKAEFQRRQIGLSDLETQRKIQSVYENLVDTANQVKFELESLMNQESIKELNLDFLIDFLKSKDPETWLVEKYVNAKGMKVDFLKTEKLIKSGLFDLPDYSAILRIRSEFDQWKTKQSQLNFTYPFSRLFNKDDNVFILNEEFTLQLTEATSIFTSSQQQNEILQTLEQMANNLNTLNSFGIKNISNQGLNVISDDLAILFKFNRRNKETPISVNPRAFRTKALRRFDIDPEFGTSEKADFWI